MEDINFLWNELPVTTVRNPCKCYLCNCTTLEFPTVTDEDYLLHHSVCDARTYYDTIQKCVNVFILMPLTTQCRRPTLQFHTKDANVLMHNYEPQIFDSTDVPKDPGISWSNTLSIFPPSHTPRTRIPWVTPKKQLITKKMCSTRHPAQEYDMWLLRSHGYMCQNKGDLCDFRHGPDEIYSKVSQWPT